MKKNYLIYIILILVVLFFSQIFFDNKIPIYKNDVRIIKQIKKFFPENYTVTVKKADLLGLEDNFYIAYGNHEYVDKLYAMEDFNGLKKYKNYVNFPIIKIFYLKTSSFTEFILNFLPTNLYDWFIEFKITEFYSFEPVIDDIFSDEKKFDKSSKIDTIKKQYTSLYSGLMVFFISDVLIEDVDNDGLDEIICYWKIFSGGSGGQKFSTIHEFIDEEINVSNGYPDFVDDYDFMSYLYSIFKYNGSLKNTTYDKSNLNKSLQLFYEDFELDKLNFNISNYLNRKLEDKDFIEIVRPYKENYSSIGNELYDLSNNKVKPLKINLRHTDIFSEFIKINDHFSLVESFYLNDENCHWCEHDWIVLGFIYNNGKWYSDRNINGDYFLSQLLNQKSFTIHEIHGTYNLHTAVGTEWHFINPNWTEESYKNTSDPFGVGIKKIPEIEKFIKKIYGN